MTAQQAPTRNDVALVLAGGVAKGAFEAGALEVITRSKVQIRRIVAASSGALNAAVLGAAVRAGQASAGAERLSSLWDANASWMQFAGIDWRGILAGQGI